VINIANNLLNYTGFIDYKEDYYLPFIENITEMRNKKIIYKPDETFKGILNSIISKMELVL